MSKLKGTRFSILLIVFLTLYGCTTNHLDISNKPLFPKMLVIAEQGNSEAQYFIGMFYNNGIGVERNYQKAFEWFQKSNLLGYPLSAYKLGCYFAGQFDVIPVDKGKAFQYKLIAAEAGYSRAQYDIAVIYANQFDFIKAQKWLKEAANQNHYPSILLLANLYKTDKYIEKNSVLAYFYTKLGLLKANAEDYQILRLQLESLKKSMTPDEIFNADNLISSWKPSPTSLTLEAYAGMQTARKVIKHNSISY